MKIQNRYSILLLMNYACNYLHTLSINGYANEALLVGGAVIDLRRSHIKRCCAQLYILWNSCDKYSKYRIMVRISCVKTLENPKWILSKLGLWINSDSTAWERYKFVIGLCFNIALISLVCQNIINSINLKEIKLLNRMTCMLIEGLTYLAKLSTIILNKKCFESILADLDSEEFNTHNQTLNEHIQFIYKISKLLFGYFIITILTYLVFGTFLPMVVNVSPMVPAPFDTGKYDIVYRFILIILCNYMAFSSIGLDTLYLTLLSLCVAQLNILDGQLLEAVNDVAVKVKSKEVMRQKCHAALRETVRLHEGIIR